MNTATLASRMLRREWRAGDLHLIVLSVVIAVACVTSVGAFTDRLRLALEGQGAELLGADLVVRSAFPPSPEWIERARVAGLETERTVSLRTVVVARERTQLAEAKAVGPAYPLRGALRVRTEPAGADRAAATGPGTGAAWVDSRLMALLGLTTGDTVKLGEATLTVTAELTFEPDRSSSFLFAPRILINHDDLASTGLIQPGSIVRYDLLVAGPPAALGAFRDWLDANLPPAVSVRGLDNAQPRFRAALDRAGRFLGLAALVSVLLAALAIAWGGRHYAGRSLDTAALLRCLGASSRTIVGVYFIQLALIGAVGGIAGTAIGYAGQQVLVLSLPQLVAVDLPLPGPLPALAGTVLGVTMLVGFALPSVLRLRRVSPLRVLRRDLDPLPGRLLGVYLAGVVTMAGLAAVIAADTRITLYVLAGTALTVVVLALCALALIRCLGTLRYRTRSTWRYGLVGLVRRTGATVGQTVAIGIGIMAILLLTVVRADLLATWQRQLPPDAANHFLINIQPDQRAAVAGFLAELGVAEPRFSPLLRARLVSINGRSVAARDYQDPFARRRLQRASNLSWRGDLPADNVVVAGSWWDPEDHGEPLLSVEHEYAAALGLGLGDVLVYQIADRSVELTIASLRRVDWDSFNPNFFLVTPSGTLHEFPTTYITSVHVAGDGAYYVRQLVERFPGITDIDIGAILTQIRRLIDRLNAALEFVFLFTLASGLVVLLSAIYSSYEERRRELAILRTVGARRRDVAAALVTEFLALGLLSGTVGAFGATATGFVVATELLSLDYRLDPGLWAIGVPAGIALVMVSGLAASLRLLNTAPWEVLRKA